MAARMAFTTAKLNRNVNPLQCPHHHPQQPPQEVRRTFLDLITLIILDSVICYELSSRKILCSLFVLQEERN